MYSIFNVTIDSSDAEKKLGRLEQDIKKFENSGNESIKKMGKDLNEFFKNLTSGKLDFSQATKGIEVFRNDLAKLQNTSRDLTFGDFEGLRRMQNSLYLVSEVVKEIDTDRLESLTEAEREAEKNARALNDEMERAGDLHAKAKKEISNTATAYDGASESMNKFAEAINKVSNSDNKDLKELAADASEFLERFANGDILPEEALNVIKDMQTEIKRLFALPKGEIAKDEKQSLKELNLELSVQADEIKRVQRETKILEREQAKQHKQALAQQNAQISMWRRLSIAVRQFGGMVSSASATAGRAFTALGKGLRGIVSIMSGGWIGILISAITAGVTYLFTEIEKVKDLIFELKEYGLELWGTFKDWVTGASDTEKAQNKLNREVESYVRQIDRAVAKNKELYTTWKDEEKSIKDRITALKELSKITGKSEMDLASMSDDEITKLLRDKEYENKKKELESKIGDFEFFKSKTSDSRSIDDFNKQIDKYKKQLSELEEYKSYYNMEERIKAEEERLKKNAEIRKRNLELEKEYNKKTSLATSEYYRELETAQIKHNEKMAKISQDEKEYSGNNIDFEKKRKEENTLYGREIQEITKKYQSYIKGINDSLTEITRTELENELSAIDEEYQNAIEELIKKLGENHPEFNKLSNSLGVLRDSKKTKAKNENELEELEMRQDIEIKGLEAIYEREQKIAELRGDEKLSYQSTQGFINKQIELEQQKLAVLRRQKAEYDSMGNKQMSESIQKQINTSELTLAQKNVEKFDNSLAELGKTIGKDLDFTTLDNGFKLLKQKFDDLRGHTEKYNELMLEYNNSTNEEERERLKGEMDQVQAQKSVLEKDILKNGLNQGANALANGIAFAGEKMKELAEATGDVKLGEMADQVSAMGNVLQSAAQGLSSGGWIGAAVGAFQSIVTQIVDGIISAKAEMKELEDNANDFEDSLRESSMLFDPSQNESIFGENKMAKMRDVLKASQDFANEYKSTIEEIESAGFQGNKTRRNFGLAFLLDPDALRQQIYLQEKSTKEYQTYLEGLRKGYDGLENMLIKTKDRNGFLNLIGIQDEYTSLKDLAPELWDEKGEFNVKNAEIFLETNTQISEEQRKQLMLIVEQKKQSEEYMEQLESMLKETFGGISSAMSDALISSIRNGEDALESLAEAGKGVINSLEQQMVSSIFNTYMSSYEDSLKKIIEGGGDENEMADLFYDMFKGMNKTVKVATKAVEEFERTALENGFDLAEATETAQEALKGGISAMTEDTASELNGNFMGLKLSAMEISQKTSDILSYSQQNNSLMRSALTALNQVVVNTDYCRHLEEINNTLDSIKRQGVKVL